jgi:hypothetical protein
MFGPGGVMPGGSTVEAAPQGRMPEDTASVPNASTAGSNILSTEAVYNDGLTNAILSGYQVGINAGNYLKDL